MSAMDDAHRSRRRSVLRPLTRTRAIVFGALAALLVVLAVLSSGTGCVDPSSASWHGRRDAVSTSPAIWMSTLGA